MQADYETKVNLDEFLKYEEEKQQAQPEAPKEAHFVINDEEEEIPIAKKDDEEKKPSAPGETYDDSSDEEEKKDKEFAQAMKQLSTNEQQKIPLSEILKKGALLEIEELDFLKLVLTRKEVKNQSLVRNLVSTYEDRYLCLTEVQGKVALVVFKKWAPKKTMYTYNKKAVEEIQGNPYEPSDDNPYGSTPAEKALEKVVESDEIENRFHWQVKSITPLERIFMIDVTSKGLFKVQIEIMMHFVNESRNPGTLPKIKKYSFGVGVADNQVQQEFFKDLETQSIKESQYYRKLKAKK